MQREIRCPVCNCYAYEYVTQDNSLTWCNRCWAKFNKIQDHLIPGAKLFNKLINTKQLTQGTVNSQWGRLE